MTRMWSPGVALLLLCGGLVTLWCASTAAPGSMLDLEAVYYGSRCLLQHHDPYQESEFLHIFEEERGETPTVANGLLLVHAGVVKCINLPTALFLLTPLAILPWGLAHTVWMVLTISSLTLASVLIWTSVANRQSGLVLFLTCFLLLNSKVLISDGNLSGMAVALCVIGSFCILEERLWPAGIVCLAVSLTLKPHISGGVWLFFLLAGGTFRKRALQTLALTIVLCVPAIAWTWQVAPQWLQELNSNLSTSASRYHINDPGPYAAAGNNQLSIIDLQTVTSVFGDNPRVYNTAAYIVCGPLLLVWAIVTLRSRPSLTQAYLGIAAIAALSMLPFYHRMYDAKVLLLTIPACNMLVARGGLTGRLALLSTAAGFVITGDIPLEFLTVLTKDAHISITSFLGKILTVLVNRPVPLLLLMLSVFYLWVYVQSARKTDGTRCKAIHGTTKGIPANGIPFVAEHNT